MIVASGGCTPSNKSHTFSFLLLIRKPKKKWWYFFYACIGGSTSRYCKSKCVRSNVNCRKSIVWSSQCRVSMFYVQTRDMWRDAGIVPSHIPSYQLLYLHIIHKYIWWPRACAAACNNHRNIFFRTLWNEWNIFGTANIFTRCSSLNCCAHIISDCLDACHGRSCHRRDSTFFHWGRGGIEWKYRKTLVFNSLFG